MNHARKNLSAVFFFFFSVIFLCLCTVLILPLKLWFALYQDFSASDFPSESIKSCMQYMIHCRHHFPAHWCQLITSVSAVFLIHIQPYSWVFMIPTFEKCLCCFRNIIRVFVYTQTIAFHLSSLYFHCGILFYLYLSSLYFHYVIFFPLYLSYMFFH